MMIKRYWWHFLKLLYDMYTNTHYSCKNDNHMSEANRGVKQGDKLSDKLFNIFIDDLAIYF